MKRVSKVIITKIETNINIHGLTEGMTLRKALRGLRAHNWGDIETGVELGLSDGSTVWVELKRAGDRSSYLMSSQRAVRYGWEHGAPVKMRTYKL